MTQWIEFTRTFQDGTPQTKAIRIRGMDRQIWFTNNAYAEVSDDIADLLANENDFINKVSEPAEPGEYYDDAPQNSVATIILPDGAFDAFTAEAGDIDSLHTDKANVTQNLSMRERVDRVYQGAAITDNGTHYALSHDGSDLILYSGGTPSDLSETYRWANTSDTLKRTLHITQQGTILATGIGGSIQRSTDGGESFTEVDTFGASIWTMTENSSGDIVASNSGPNGTIALYRSTDDGATWTQIADGTTFSEASRHVHRVTYHPVNDYLIVTIGDSNTTGFYRSTDDGTSWDYYNPLGVQWVGICPHPTDGSRYILAGDDTDWGPIAVIDDDGTSVSATPVLETTLDESPPNAMGSFDVACLHDENGPSGYILAGAGDEDPRVWVSDGLDGGSWRSLGSAHVDGYTYVGNQTGSMGPYESIIDVTATDSVIIGGVRISTNAALDYHYGSDSERGLDQRRSYGDINMEPRHRIRFDRGFGQADLLPIFQMEPDDGDISQISYQFGNFKFRNANTGAEVEFDTTNEWMKLNGWVLHGIRTVTNAATTDLTAEETAIDLDRGGTGTAAVLYKDSNGAVHYWDADGTL